MSTILTIPRGKQNLPPISLDMTKIYSGEDRLKEIAYVNPNTSRELSSFFNEVTNETTKYLAWVEYEILQAQQVLDIAKAKVILETAPVEAAKIKAKDPSFKANTEWREALIAVDLECQHCRDVLDALTAVKYLLESKAKTFERAYFSAKMIGEEKNRVAATPNLNGCVGQLSTGIGVNYGK